jgi:hypothetical protein
MKRITTAVLVFSWLPQWFFIVWCRNHPLWVDHYYGNTLYPWLQSARIYFLERLAFSFGDLIYLALLSGIGVLVIHFRKKLFQNLWERLSQGMALLAAVHLFYQLSWGLNYYRTPLAVQQNIPLEYEEWELESTLAILIQKTESLHDQLSVSDSTPVVFPLRKQDYIRLLGNTPAKKSLWSWPLTYMGYAGYLNPFTGEAQVNSLLPMLSFIHTAAHERGHQEGIAAENEANFHAFLTTYQHDNKHIRYAAYCFALRYCWSALYRLNPGCANERTQKLRSGIRKEYQAQQAFWNAHRNPLQPILDKVYDRFLKANGQAAGQKSYSQVVALLVAYQTEL